MPAVPTQGEEFAKLLDYMHKSQESCYMMAHLTRAQGSTKDHSLADGWMAVGEMYKRLIYQVTQLAQGHLQ